MHCPRVSLRAHENHEPRIMIVLIRRAVRRARMGLPPPFRRIAMKWITPQAIDLRFGMEITMYIANR
jgi:coenzyme PQQ precursor peptide PqqA